MSDVKVCRICLIMGVKMYNLQGYPLENYLEPIIGMNPLSMVELPLYACFECATLIKKYYLFREKCLRGQSTLYDILHRSEQINPIEIKEIDRHNLHLASKLTFHMTPPEDTYEFVYDELQAVKEESTHSEYIANNDKNLIIEVDGIKEEAEDYFQASPLHASSDDDDEPLSLHKTKGKVDKKKEKKGGRRKKKDVSGEVSEVSMEQPERLEEVTNKVQKLAEIPTKPVEKPRRGRKRKDDTEVVKEKKKRGPRGTVGLTPDELDMEEYVTIIKLTPQEQLAEIVARQHSSNYTNAPLKCELCFKGFIDDHAFQHHILKHEATAGDVECNICKFRFKTRRLLQKHAANHEKKYSCKSCPYISKTTTQAKQHQKWHKGVTYKCQHCDEVSTKWTSYLSHVRIKHPSEFICSVCGYSFVSKLGLNMHKTMMHKERVKKECTESAPAEPGPGPYCAECSVQFVSLEAYNRHMVTSSKHVKNNHFGNGCRVCGTTFETGEELRLHHRKMHARKRPKNYGKKPNSTVWPSACTHCSEEIPNAREYWTHFRRAHPDKKYPIQKAYICEICGKGFRGNAFLVYHKRTHFEERAYKCAQCPKAFFNRTNLQMHEKTHSDHRPYPCNVCFKAFKSKGALDRHFRSHTGVKPYECEFCGKAFGQSNSRKLHVRTVHLKQPAPYISKTRLERRRQHAHTDSALQNQY